MNVYKAERIVREMVLFVCAISIFPFMTLRVLIWKWHYWIRKNELIINKDNYEFQGITYKIDTILRKEFNENM